MRVELPLRPLRVPLHHLVRAPIRCFEVAGAAEARAAGPAGPDALRGVAAVLVALDVRLARRGVDEVEGVFRDPRIVEEQRGPVRADGLQLVLPTRWPLRPVLHANLTRHGPHYQYSDHLAHPIFRVCASRV